MKIGVVGAGFWAPFQLSGWQEIEGAEIVGIASLDFPRAEELAAKHGIGRTFRSLDDLLDWGEFDILDVISSVPVHVDHVCAGAAAGKHIICQKPLSDDIDGAIRAIESCERHNVRLLVNENWRSQLPLSLVRDLIREGTIGTPFRARFQFSSSFSVYDNQPALAVSPRFILSDVGIHILDAARSLFGEAESLYCQTSRVGPIKGEDVGTVIMQMSGCPTVTVELSYATRWSEEQFPETFLLVEGSLGSIEIRKGSEVVVTTANGTTRQKVEFPQYTWADPAYALIHSSIVDCQRHLLSAITTGAPSPLDGRQNLKSLQLVEAAYTSAQTQSLIRLQP